MGPDFYEVLGVAPDADADQITRAFRHLIRTLHPDATGPAVQDQATGERLAQVLAAWRVLHDPAARSAYDGTRTAPDISAPSAADRGERLVPEPDGGDAVLVAGPTIIHGRAPRPSGPHIRVGPPVRLDE
jgi:DnaJ-class molecular chaperone